MTFGIKDLLKAPEASPKLTGETLSRLPGFSFSRNVVVFLAIETIPFNLFLHLQLK